MKIVVNTRLLLKNRLEGIGRFSYETLKRITANNPQHQFFFTFDRDFDEEFIFSGNITPITIFPPARHPFLFWWWFEISLPPLLRRLKPDLFLSPDAYLSLSSPVRQLPVIHDLNFAHYPQDVPFLVRKYYNHFFPKFARKATRIATVSEFSKLDITRLYGIDEKNIDVVYNGVNAEFSPLPDTERETVKKQYSRSCDYFLFVGSLHPRKNIARLMTAFDAFRRSNDSNVKLVIVGARYWWTNEIRQAYESMQFKDEVIFTGRLHDSELYRVMASALGLVYVPYFEGFGIPLLEAMKSDVPVITSDITSMPEVAADAALYADPFSVDSIAQAMRTLHADKELRNRLIEKGRMRSSEFSWDRSADLLWKSILKAVDN